MQIRGPAGIDRSKRRPIVSQQIEQDTAWRREVSQRLEAYRTRRRRLVPSAAQSQFSFADPSGKTPPQTSTAVAEPPGSVEEDFSFTVRDRPPRKERCYRTIKDVDRRLCATGL